MKLKDKDFKTIDFDQYEKEIAKIFDTLSAINGIKYTGATKIMHLTNRRVFVMWDSYIKGEKSIKDYNKLEIVKKGYWKPKKI